MRTKRVSLLLCVFLLLTGCASFGKSDPVVVRAEDVQANSLALYKTVIVDYHMVHSQQESVAVYQVLEKIRVEFPPAWRSLSVAIPAYEQTRDAKLLIDKRGEVEKLYNELKGIWATHLLARGEAKP